jgi:hypothetical protein
MLDKVVTPQLLCCWFDSAQVLYCRLDYVIFAVFITLWGCKLDSVKNSPQDNIVHNSFRFSYVAEHGSAWIQCIIITDSIEWRSSWEVNILLPIQEICCLLCKLKIHYSVLWGPWFHIRFCVCKSPPLHCSGPDESSPDLHIQLFIAKSHAYQISWDSPSLIGFEAV